MLHQDVPHGRSVDVSAASNSGLTAVKEHGVAVARGVVAGTTTTMTMTTVTIATHELKE